MEDQNFQIPVKLLNEESEVRIGSPAWVSYIMFLYLCKDGGRWFSTSQMRKFMNRTDTSTIRNILNNMKLQGLIEWRDQFSTEEFKELEPNKGKKIFYIELL